MGPATTSQRSISSQFVFMAVSSSLKVAPPRGERAGGDHGHDCPVDEDVKRLLPEGDEELGGEGEGEKSVVRFCDLLNSCEA